MSSMRAWALVVGWALSMTSLISCGGGSSGVPKCVPGQATSCTGPNACQGNQVCQDDGKFGACVCADTGTGGGSGAGTTGASGASGSDAAAGSGAAGAAGGASDCNPVAQTGCGADQRCTWITTSDTTGHAACLADGTVAVGGACTQGPDGETTGFDNCKRGLTCVDYTCESICKASPDSCGFGYACIVYSSGPFATPERTYGFCEASCNPLTQVRSSDGAPACGSPVPSNPTIGCYGFALGPFTCQKVLYGYRVADVIAGADPKAPYVNGCAAGFLPILKAPNGVNVVCAAMCQPAPTSIGTIANAGGLVGSGRTCVDEGAAGMHECRYLWFLQDPNAPGFPTTYGNTLGFCLDYTKYTYKDASSNLDTVLPSCTTLDSTKHTYSSTATDDVFWGCGPIP
jgi:hypothetical protein